MPRWRWRCRRGRRGRPPSELFLHMVPRVREFVPKPVLDEKPIVLSFPELEALRLIDVEDMSHEAAAARMGTSRATVWRLVKSGRAKVVSSLVEGRPLVVMEGGEVREVET